MLTEGSTAMNQGVATVSIAAVMLAVLIVVMSVTMKPYAFLTWSGIVISVAGIASVLWLLQD
jgi:Na+-transporting methylmalonyl-CoA/oxaloacetate decarboxylase gamma subunit